MKPCEAKTKVLFMLPATGAGGAERILITLMNNLDREKFQPVFLSLRDEGPIKSWIADDIPLHTFGNRSVKGSIFKLIAFVREYKPDVIFTTMVHTNALALLMKILFPKIRVIIREAALPSALISRYGLKGRMCIFVYKMLYGFADLVVSNCSQMVDDFRDKIKIRTDNHRILFNPVDTGRIFASIPETFDSVADRENTLCFVAVGRLSYEKGYDRLIERLAAFTPSARNWRLDIIGEGDYRETLEALIDKHGLCDRVLLRGYESNPWKIAGAGDCLLLPSRWEGMPNVVLEGFACGLPAIAMREAGGIADIAKYTSEAQLTITDTLSEFVEAMHNVEIAPKQSKADSTLPDAFLLPEIMEAFEGMLLSVEDTVSEKI